MMLNMRVRLTTAAFQLIDFDDPYHADTDMFLVTMMRQLLLPLWDGMVSSRMF